MAQLGDMVIFRCMTNDAIWTFNNGPLPLAVFPYSYFGSTGYLHSIAIIVHDDSYFGQYTCLGEFIQKGFAFYAVGSLTRQGK